MNTIPTKKQLYFLNWEFGVFFHFGIRSFNPGHVDWDGIEMSADTFNPDFLDCEQWIKSAKDAGAKYAILTTKHHDGFANWPTQYSSYSVSATPWKNGKGDVVAEFVSACRKYGIAVGLYYSPAQWGNGAVKFEIASEYDDYFINQISELLTNYGKIDYLWFDSCGSDGHVYDEERIITVIRSLQPEILIFNMWEPDTLWVGNEDGYCNLPNNNIHGCEVFGKSETGFFPSECDCRIRNTWFYDFNDDKLKDVDELVGMYEMSVGRGANLLLNIGPDNHGQICSADLNRLNEFALEIKRRYCVPLDFCDIYSGNNDTFSIEYSAEAQKEIVDDDKIPLVRSVIIEEDITNGNSVKQFKLYACLPHINPIPETHFCIYNGETIGHKVICRFPAIRTAKIIMKVLSHSGEYTIKSLRAFQ